MCPSPLSAKGGLPYRGHRSNLCFEIKPNGLVVYLPYSIGQYCGHAVAYLVALTLARVSHDVETNPNLHNDRIGLPWGSGEAQMSCQEYLRLRNAAADVWKQAMRAPQSERCGALYHASLAATETLNYANSNHGSCGISVPLLSQVEGYHREAYWYATMFIGRPLRPYPADIIQR